MGRVDLSRVLVVAVVGLIFHAIAKLYVVQGHEIACVTEIKSLWAAAKGQLPNSILIASKLGHLLSAVVYLGLFVSAYQIAADPRQLRYWSWNLAFLLAGIVYASLLISRTVLLTFVVVFALGALLFLVAASLKLRTRVWRFAIVMVPVMLSTFSISLTIFDLKMYCGEWRTEEAIGEQKGVDGDWVRKARAQGYLEGFLDELPIRDRLAQPVSREGTTNLLDNASLNRVLNPARSNLFALCPQCNMALLYLNHGLYNYESMAAKGKRGDSILLKAVAFYTRRAGFAIGSQENRRVYGAGGATLVGSVWHDLGIIGASGLLIAMVGAVWLIPALLSAGGWVTAIGLSVYVAVGVVIAFGYLFVGIQIISFPFAVLSVLLSPLFVRRRVGAFPVNENNER